jgi:hypothetical protein
MLTNDVAIVGRVLQGLASIVLTGQEVAWRAF